MDERLRALERAAASGDDEALARLLRERVRYRTPEEWDALVQHLERARTASRWLNTEDWLHDLGWRWGHIASLRAAIAIARTLHRKWNTQFPSDLRPLEAIQAAEALALAPTIDGLAYARLAWKAAVEAAQPLLDVDARDDAGNACMAAAMGWAEGAPPDRRDHGRVACHFARRIDPYSIEDEVRAAVLRELVPWARHEGDPIADRAG